MMLREKGNRSPDGRLPGFSPQKRGELINNRPRSSEKMNSDLGRLLRVLSCGRTILNPIHEQVLIPRRPLLMGSCNHPRVSNRTHVETDFALRSLKTPYLNEGSSVPTDYWKNGSPKNKSKDKGNKDCRNRSSLISSCSLTFLRTNVPDLSWRRDQTGYLEREGVQFKVRYFHKMLPNHPDLNP